MYLAPVTPPRILEYLPESVRHHLVLSNEVLDARRIYEDYFTRSRSLLTILDNPVHERKPIPPLIKRSAAAKIIGATAVVAPDAIGDVSKSMLLLASHFKTSIAQSYTTMAVIQGRDLDEYASYIERVVKRFSVSLIGVPQIRRFDVAFSRYTFIRKLEDSGFFARYPSVRIHLLGNTGLFEDAILLRGVPQVVGIDSAKPVYLAAYGIDIRNMDHARSVRRPSGFFEMTKDEVDLDVLKHNVETLQEWIGGDGENGD